MEILTEITCNKCKTSKSTSEFYKHKNHKSGFRGECKACCQILNKAFRDANPNYNNSQYLKKREVVLAKQKIYVANNKQAIQTRNRAYQERTKETRAVYAAAWTKRNAEKNRLKAHLRRQKQKANGVFEISVKEMKKLYASPCVYCGSSDRIEADHVIPLSKGGRQSIGNLVPSCLLCNRSKGNRYIVEWRKSARLEKR